MAKADSNQKFDQGRISRILALVIELNDLELSQLTQKIHQELNRRSKSKGGHDETISV